MSRILITGASGHVGKQLTDWYDHEILRPSRNELDMADKISIRNYIQKNKPEVIIHLAGILKGQCDKNRDLALMVNSENTQYLYVTGLANGLQKFIFLSSSSVYNQTTLQPTKEDENIDPKTLYGETKLIAEQMLEHVVGCPIVIFRAFNIYGEGFSDSLINRLISRKVTLRSPNDYWRDYINVQDVVRFIRYSVADDFKDGVHIFNLGTGTAYSSMAIVEYLQGLGFQLNYKVKEDGIFTVSWADTEKLLKKFYTVPDYHLHFS